MQAAVVDAHLRPPMNAYLHPTWALGQVLDMHVRLSTSSSSAALVQEGLPEFVWKGIHFGNWSETRTEALEIKLPNVIHSIFAIFARRKLTCYVIERHSEWIPLG